MVQGFWNAHSECTEAAQGTKTNESPQSALSRLPTQETRAAMRVSFSVGVGGNNVVCAGVSEGCVDGGECGGTLCKGVVVCVCEL